MSTSGPLPSPEEHVAALADALDHLGPDLPRIERWGRHLADVLVDGGRLLACGNGGSAADAQHLTAELVGRYRDERAPLSAIALTAETSTLTAVANDYDYDEVFARQIRAHGRPGDLLVAISTSGTSANVVAAARAAREHDLRVLALTGPVPNDLGDVAHDVVGVRASATATIQEVHGVVVHLLCAAVDRVLVEDARVVDLRGLETEDAAAAAGAEVSG